MRSGGKRIIEVPVDTATIMLVCTIVGGICSTGFAASSYLGAIKNDVSDLKNLNSSGTAYDRKQDAMIQQRVDEIKFSLTEQSRKFERFSTILERMEKVK